MKKIILTFFVVSAVCGICFAADPAEGFWLSIDEQSGIVTAGWEVYQEEGKLYGRILSMRAAPRLADRCRDSYPGFPITGKVNEMPVIGTPWIYGLTMNKIGEWRKRKMGRFGRRQQQIWADFE